MSHRVTQIRTAVLHMVQYRDSEVRHYANAVAEAIDRHPAWVAMPAPEEHTLREAFAYSEEHKADILIVVGYRELTTETVTFRVLKGKKPAPKWVMPLGRFLGYLSGEEDPSDALSGQGLDLAYVRTQDSHPALSSNFGPECVVLAVEGNELRICRDAITHNGKRITTDPDLVRALRSLVSGYKSADVSTSSVYRASIG